MVGVNRIYKVERFLKVDQIGIGDLRNIVVVFFFNIIRNNSRRWVDGGMIGYFGDVILYIEKKGIVRYVLKFFQNFRIIELQSQSEFQKYFC